MGFRSGVVLNSKQAQDFKVSALSERLSDAFSKDEIQTAEVKSQELGVGISAFHGKSLCHELNRKLKALEPRPQLWINL